MKNLATIITILLFSISNVFAGGPWPQKKGNAYIKLSEWWTIFNQHYTDTGNLDPNVTTGVFNTLLYAEYGITDKLTLNTNAALFSRNLMNNLISETTQDILVTGEALNSIGDIDLGLKYGFKIGKHIPAAISVNFGLPTGKASGGSEGNLQTGDGEFNQVIQLDVGKSFQLASTNFYIAASAGLNNRSKGFSEELRLGLEAGFGSSNGRLWVIGRLNILESLKNGDTAATINSTSIFANNAEYSALSLEINYGITDNFGLSAGFSSAFRGEIIAAAPSYNVGAYITIN